MSAVSPTGTDAILELRLLDGRLIHIDGISYRPIKPNLREASMELDADLGRRPVRIMGPGWPPARRLREKSTWTYLTLAHIVTIDLEAKE